MTSRLDRLFLLLDTGSSPLTRKAAALQLGEVQKLHPHELHNLLSKVRNYLHSSSWDTRIAAGQAVEAVITAVPQWCPQGTASNMGGLETSDSVPTIAQTGRMKFSKFDIHKVIQHGSDLLASEGKEYEMEEELIEMDPKERLAKQRQLLNKRLGLDMAEKIGFDTSDIFSNEDLSVKVISCEENSQENNKRTLAEVFCTEISQFAPNLAARNNSKAKRRARFLAKHRSADRKDISNSSHSMEDDDPATKRQRWASSIKIEQNSPDDAMFADNTSDSEGLWEESKEWPFESVSDELAQDLFNPSWEVRHGAGIALREIVRIHGTGAGKSLDVPDDQMDIANQFWLEDIALRLLCVLSLDKFGDFISDEVVAPVRETCSQALGSVINLMWKQSVEGVLHVLLQLLERPEWEARHGGLLGLKYLLAVRHDMTAELVPSVFEPVFLGLKDTMDDVSAVAAAALVPVTGILVGVLPHQVPRVIAFLWDALLELDDLTASTRSILLLLSSLLSYAQRSVGQGITQSLEQLVPRLWPFLKHNSSTVRKSVLQALVTITSGAASQPYEGWSDQIITEALCLTYQRALIEPCSEIQDLLYQVWQHILAKVPLTVLLNASCPYLSGWLCMMMQPSKVPYDSSVNSFWLEIRHETKEKASSKGRKPCSTDIIKDGQNQYYIGGIENLNSSVTEREKYVLQARCIAARFLGMLFCYVMKPVPGVVYTSDMEMPVDSLAKLLLFHLNSKSALQRIAVALVLLEWAKHDKDMSCPLSVKTKCLDCVAENIYYDEIALTFTRMQQDCRDFIAMLRHHNLPLDITYQAGVILTLDQATSLATTVSSGLLHNTKLKPKVLETLEERRKSVLNTVSRTNCDQLSLSTAVQACLAGAIVALKFLPDKLNPVIRPLMESVKREENKQLQTASACHLVQLMNLCLSRTPCPNAKIIKNIITFLCSDPVCTPVIGATAPSVPNSPTRQDSMDLPSSRTATPIFNTDNYLGIITLVNMQKSAEKVTLRRSNSLNAKKTLTTNICIPLDGMVISDDETQRSNELQRRGATFALAEAAQCFGALLPEKLVYLWDAIFHSLTQFIKPEDFDPSAHCGNDSQAQELVYSLQILEAIGPSLHVDLYPQLESILPHLCCGLEHPYTAVRHMAARCMGMLSRVITMPLMEMILDKVLQRLGATDSDTQRQGSVECLACIIDNLGLGIVPYIVLLVVPMLGRMSDQNEHVRLMATHCFASLIRLMPLEGGIKDAPILCPAIVDRKNQERRFLEQLLDPKKLENFVVPLPIKAELRSYQQAGVNWLAFLNKYKLHGILCDDMGLGKTLQSICMLATDHLCREKKYNETNSPDCKPLPSLVVCPPTLTGHWMYEVEKFVGSQYLNPLHYTGPPSERMRLRSKAKRHNLIIASYDIVRNDIDFFSSFRWNYCILDEGHIIKNGKTKLARAIKQLSANHRLILTGTPIQNNVLELWSLFDFLMPGFLGTEKQFTARYSKPILQSRDAKLSSKEQEAGVLAMESLHRQVLPFLLRRMKADVLQDLPPKIMQDYYCDLSPLQIQLYEDFARSRAKHNLEETLGDDDATSVQNTTHIFQALQYLRKVCNHPKLVLMPQHPEYERITSQLKQQNTSLADIQHAAKLNALRQLLMDCGIGTTPLSTLAGPPGPEPVVNQHRALVFCQLKSMLEILETDLFKTHMPGVSYLRLDGSIPAGMRHAVVRRFNSDPSIDILLLTTQVGGLGLNLTGADTVIFVEHDWNPMRDLQAMDRAHRIGQKKVVNVYRLITRGTLEEKIMGLQKFKLSIANTVISQENSHLQTMGADQLLDLFTLDKKGDLLSGTGSADTAAPRSKGMKAVLDNLPELWDTDQYETEFDLCSFVQSLCK